MAKGEFFLHYSANGASTVDSQDTRRIGWWKTGWDALRTSIDSHVATINAAFAAESSAKTVYGIAVHHPWGWSTDSYATIMEYGQWEFLKRDYALHRSKWLKNVLHEADFLRVMNAITDDYASLLLYLGGPHNNFYPTTEEITNLKKYTTRAIAALGPITKLDNKSQITILFDNWYGQRPWIASPLTNFTFDNWGFFGGEKSDTGGAVDWIFEELIDQGFKVGCEGGILREARKLARQASPYATAGFWTNVENRVEQTVSTGPDTGRSMGHWRSPYDTTQEAYVEILPTGTDAQKIAEMTPYWDGEQDADPPPDDAAEPEEQGVHTVVQQSAAPGF